MAGVDLGGSRLRGALFAPEGAAVAERAEETAASTPATIVAQLRAFGRRLAAAGGVDWADVDAFGIGVPGVVSGGRLTMAPNLPAFGDVDVEAALAHELEADVVIDNDVNMAALGEQRRGLGDSVDDFVFVSVGTGVGMGIVAGGRLVRGARGAAGEIGELAVGEGLTLEAVAGGAGIASRSEHATAFDVFAAASDGSPEAAAVLEHQVSGIAGALSIVQRILDPELVVLGGGIGSRADFLARVRARVCDVRVERSALGEWAGAVGAGEAARARSDERIRA